MTKKSQGKSKNPLISPCPPPVHAGGDGSTIADAHREDERVEPAPAAEAPVEPGKDVTDG